MAQSSGWALKPGVTIATLINKLLNFWRRSERRLNLDLLTTNWLIIFSGTTVRIGLNFLTGVIITRTLGPADFGVYAVLLAAASLIGVAVDFGLTEAAVKNIAVAWSETRTAAVRQSLLLFWIKLGLALAGVGLTLLLAPLIVRYLLRLPDHSWLFALMLVSVVTTTMSGSMNAILQAIGKFRQISLALIISSGVSLLLALCLALLGQLTLVTALVGLSVATSLTGFLVGYAGLPVEWPGLKSFLLRPPAGTRWLAEARSLLRFGSWLWLANIGKVLLAYLDMFLVNLWLDPVIVGAYALALGLARRAEIINHSLYTVLLPAASALKTGRAIGSYLYQGLLRSLLVSSLLLALIPLSEWLIPFLYGQDYVPAVRLFQLLLGLAIFDIVTLPPTLLIYTFERPELATLTEGLRVVILLLLAWGLVSSMGVVGVIVAKFGAKFVGVVVTLAALWWHYVRRERSQAKSG